MPDSMRAQDRRSHLRLLGVLSAAVLLPSGAQAGAFALREQSAVGSGMAYAGEGTSAMGLGAMFWNPAAVTLDDVAQGELHLQWIAPRSTIHASGTTSPELLALGNHSTEISREAVVGSMYGAFRFKRLHVGLALASPFGLKSLATAPTPSQNLALRASAKSFEVNPVVGYRINDSVSVAFGARILWAEAEYSRALVPLASAPNTASLEASDVGAGWNAGISFAPADRIELAFGYRSKVDLRLGGDVVLPPIAPLAGSFDVSGEATLPDQFAFGFRRAINDSFTLLGTLEHQNWSVLQAVPFLFTSGPATGAPATTLRFHYSDSVYAAVGAEYRFSAQTVLRAGLGFETTPITDDVRGTALPSNDGWRLSAGMSRTFEDKTVLDVALSYYKEKDAPITIVPGHPDSGNLAFPPPIGQLAYFGVGRVDLWSISAAVRHKFGAD